MATKHPRLVVFDEDVSMPAMSRRQPDYLPKSRAIKFTTGERAAIKLSVPPEAISYDGFAHEPLRCTTVKLSVRIAETNSPDIAGPVVNRSAREDAMPTDD